MWVFCWIHQLDVQGTTPAPKPKFFQSWFVSINIYQARSEYSLPGQEKNMLETNLILLVKTITLPDAMSEDVFSSPSHLRPPCSQPNCQGGRSTTARCWRIAWTVGCHPDDWGLVTQNSSNKSETVSQKRKTEICLPDMWHASWFWVSWMFIAYILSLLCCDRFSSV